jgi:hypothetical protein
MNGISDVDQIYMRWWKKNSMHQNLNLSLPDWIDRRSLDASMGFNESEMMRQIYRLFVHGIGCNALNPRATGSQSFRVPRFLFNNRFHLIDSLMPI